MKFIDIHTHILSNQDDVFEIENRYPNAIEFNNSFSIGIHPWYINKEKTKEELAFIKKQLQLDNCYAIGECGLDKLTETNFEYQIDIFKQQITLSEEYQKPLIIHCVKAFQEIIQLKKELKPKQPWIVHGFKKNKQVALSLIKNGLFLSFGKQLLTSDKLQDAFSGISLDKIFFETDADDIGIQDIYQKGAMIKELEVEKLKEIIYQNFNSIFIK